MSSSVSTNQQSKPSDFFVGAIDQRYNILNQTINIDASGSRVLIQRRSSNTGTSTLIGNACFNTKQTYFDISSSSDLRQYLPGLTIMCRGYATIEDGTTQVDRTAVSIPWDSAAALLNGIQVRINGNGNPVEIYSNNRYDIAHLTRMVMEYSRTTLEGLSETLFTPCFESDAETNLQLSLEAQARSLKWLTDASGKMIKRQLLWPLGYLCSFAAVPAFLDIKRLEIFLDWKNPAEVCFKLSTYAHTPYYFIDDVQVILDQSSMSVFQSSLELKESITSNSTQRLFYKYYDVLETQYISSGTVVRNGVQNLEAAVLMFPCSILHTPAGIQYPNALQMTSNNLTTISFYYQGYSVPTTPMVLDVYNTMSTVEAYYHYKKCCKKELTMNFVPAIPWDTGYANESNPHNDSTYFLYCASFSNALAPHLSDAGELRVVTSQTVMPDPELNSLVPCKCYLVCIRNVAFEMHPDGTAEKWWA